MTVEKPTLGFTVPSADTPLWQMRHFEKIFQNKTQISPFSFGKIFLIFVHCLMLVRKIKYQIFVKFYQ